MIGSRLVPLSTLSLFTLVIVLPSFSASVEGRVLSRETGR
jgi:hypothetical protein